jgi:hypothetical protein
MSVVEPFATDRVKVCLFDVNRLASFLVKETETVIGSIRGCVDCKEISIKW